MTKEELLGAAKEAVRLHNLAFAGAELSEATGVVRVTVDTWSSAGKGLTPQERQRLELARAWLVERLPLEVCVEFVEAASPILRLDALRCSGVDLGTYVNLDSDWAKEFGMVVDRACEAISQTLLPAATLPFPSCGSYAPARIQQDIEADFIDASAIAWSHVMRQTIPLRIAGHALAESARRLARLGLLWRHVCRGCAGRGKGKRRLLRAIMTAATRELGQ